MKYINKDINNNTYLYYYSQVINNCVGIICPGEWTWSNSKKRIIKQFKEVFLNNILKELYDDESIEPYKNINSLKDTKAFKNSKQKRTFQKIIVLFQAINENQEDSILKELFKTITKLLSSIGLKCEAYYFSDYNEALKLVIEHNSYIYENDLVRTFKEDISL